MHGQAALCSILDPIVVSGSTVLISLLLHDHLLSKKKIMQRFRGLKVVEIGTFMKYLSCFSLFLYSLFWFLFHSSHSAVILKNFHWSLSKIALIASEVMSEKTCKLLPLINIRADLFFFFVWTGGIVHGKQQKIMVFHRECKVLELWRPSRLALIILSFLKLFFIYKWNFWFPLSWLLENGQLSECQIQLFWIVFCELAY